MWYGGYQPISNWFPQDSVARGQAQDAKSLVEQLEDRINRLSLLSMAAWSLASEKLGITPEEFQKRVEELDLSDGKLDGKITPQVGECPKCKKQLSKRNRSCIYCGYKLPPSFPG